MKAHTKAKAVPRRRMFARRQSATSRSSLRPARLHFSPDRHQRLTHYLFRYPAKFHPPIAVALLEKYSRPGDLVLDPFCGSGTLLVEAQVMGRNAIGVDVDPVAQFIAKAKTCRISMPSLRRSSGRLLKGIEAIRRSREEYERLMFSDISKDAFSYAVARLQLRVPEIPNIFHWFRRYVVVDLARLRSLIDGQPVPNAHKLFFLACLGSIIRNVSNADPVPVSGLEVTSHMKRKDAAGRLIDPFAHFTATVTRALADREDFEKLTTLSGSTIRVIGGDSAYLRRYIRKPVDVVITSPPYHNAVDYYRRHTLEMYWLDLVACHEDRLSLLPRYIGRSRVPMKHPFVVKADLVSPLARQWERIMRKHCDESADAFKHYAIAMQKCFSSLACRMRPRSTAVFVLGRSSWNGRRLPTTRLFEELAGPHFQLREHYWYPLKNRYMTYSRHNGASIDKEYVLVFERVER